MKGLRLWEQLKPLHVAVGVCAVKYLVMPAPRWSTKQSACTVRGVSLSSGNAAQLQEVAAHKQHPFGPQGLQRRCHEDLEHLWRPHCCQSMCRKSAKPAQAAPGQGC